MEKIKKIITHGGVAHLDDLLSVSLACYLHPSANVERRDPTADELNDPGVLVLDVGGAYDPPKNNFDHHQLHEGNECALSLYAREILLHDELTLHDGLVDFPWYAPLVEMDNRGPFAFATKRKISPNLVFELNSPIEHLLRKSFGSGTFVSDEILNLLNFVGRGIINDAKKQIEGLLNLSKRSKIIFIGGLQGVLIAGDDMTGFERWRKNFPDLAFRIAWDDRGPGLALLRLDDHPAIDFKRVEGNEAIEFVHKNGFICKTKTRDLDLARTLVKESITR